MLKLSKRLMMTAGCVTKGYTAADIGCDHAYLSIYLVVHKIAERVIAMDVNIGPLKIAQENVIRYNAGDKIELRLSDGLDKLMPSEADAIVLAGMGGELMVSILTKGMSCVNKAKELILSPQSEPHKIRRFINAAGYNISYEDMCIDMGKYYTVIKAVNMDDKRVFNTENTYNIKGTYNTNDKQYTEYIYNTRNTYGIEDTHNTGNVYGIEDTHNTENTYNISAEEAYGGYLLEHKNEVLKMYLDKELSINKSIQSELCKNLTDKAYYRLLQCREDEARIMDALKYYKLNISHVN